MMIEDKELARLYREESARWVEIAAKIADQDVQPDPELISLLNSLPRPRIKNRREAFDGFWKLLSFPHRHRGLRWLDEQELLGELLPCWTGNAIRRDLRLSAVEQLHLESWRKGLNIQTIEIICNDLDSVIDGRSNRWALTALAILLAGGDTENQISWAKMVRRDLYALGATEAEIVWIETIIRGFNNALKFLRGDLAECELTPAIAVAGLSTLYALKEEVKPEVLLHAAERTNTTLKKYQNPLDNIDIGEE